MDQDLVHVSDYRRPVQRDLVLDICMEYFRSTGEKKEEAGRAVPPGGEGVNLKNNRIYVKAHRVPHTGEIDTEKDNEGLR